MAKMLGRSRSLRILRGGHKEPHQQDNAIPSPPSANPQVVMERLKVATPVTCADRRVETPDMLQRPKTSSGPGDRGKQFHKKTTPVALASDEQLNFSSPSPSKSSTTLLYTAEIHGSSEGIIGIALGSPTMASNWNPPQPTDFFTNYPGTITQITSNAHVVERTEDKQEAQKPRLSRWKSIFGKKTAPPPEQKPSFYQLAQSIVPTRADSHHDNESVDSRVATHFDESPDDYRSPSPPAFRPEIRESRKLPKGQVQPVVETRPRALTVGNVGGISPAKSSSTLLRSTSSPRVPPKDVRNSPTVPRVMVSGASQVSSPTSLADKPLLDVDIPSIKMERYSVMFGNLLGPNPTSNQSSSLLVRRQGNAERLKPLNELSMKQEESSHKKSQRRATSPSLPPKSPSVSLSLFPQPSNHTKAPSPRSSSATRMRPLQRSKTTPAVSPNRPSFSLSRTTEDEAKDVSQSAKPLKPPQRTQKFTSPANLNDLHLKSALLSPSTSSCNSFDSDPEEVTVVVGRTSPVNSWKPQIKEPEWEIVSKPSIRRRPSHREMREALSSHPTTLVVEPPRQPASAPLEFSRSGINSKPHTPQITEPGSAPGSGNRLAVAGSSKLQSSPKEQNETQATIGIGIARSVSVSRASPRSADLLKPVLIQRAADSSERLVDTRALTPTLVELKNRRSQRVQLVDA